MINGGGYFQAPVFYEGKIKSPLKINRKREKIKENI